VIAGSVLCFWVHPGHLVKVDGGGFCATLRELGKLQLTQNRAALLSLKCTQKANISNMHVHFPWLKVEERLTSSLLVFVRSFDMLNAQSLFKLLAHSSDNHV
jgi:hypothetical protein